MTEHEHLRYLETFEISSEEGKYNVSLYIFQCSDAVNCTLLHDALHKEERTHLARLTFDKRIHDFLLGRFAAKNALASIMQVSGYSEIGVRSGMFRQPVVTGVCLQALQTSITHCDRIGAALAFDEGMPAGIDIEKVNPERFTLIQDRCTEAEREWAHQAGIPAALAATLLWTSKEAIAKAIKTGFTASLDIFEVERIERQDDYWITYYRYFTQFRAVSFPVGRYVCTIATPKRAMIKPDIKRLKELFEWLPPMSFTR
ncbi:4'-phosphopantetheinyl transferase family protein [Paenibacillus kobensis]|uniref:4'-phosphopantetheinyl transferase family protein n=1 Tax=Paenibacillus kobensis TaxID=59841 RepID=UPI000FD7642D|nr:4'-phosphopantetheinyl transferase superfamily protein [Paenibacillus kobensis]